MENHRIPAYCLTRPEKLYMKSTWCILDQLEIDTFM